MPAYTVTSIAGRFSADQKNRLAAAITGVHCTTTGAPPFLVQVIFNEVSPGDYFVGGKPIKFDSIMVHGHIRAGHDSETKSLLISEIMHSAAAISETDRSAIQIYIVEVPANQFAEWGRILPPPGDEAAWGAELPPDVRLRIDAVLESH